MDSGKRYRGLYWFVLRPLALIQFGRKLSKGWVARHLGEHRNQCRKRLPAIALRPGALWLAGCPADASADIGD